MKKLTKNEAAYVYCTYIGRYVTRIVASGENVYQNDGTELDLEGEIMLLKLKYDGYKIEAYF